MASRSCWRIRFHGLRGTSPSRATVGSGGSSGASSPAAPLSIMGEPHGPTDGLPTSRLPLAIDGSTTLLPGPTDPSTMRTPSYLGVVRRPAAINRIRLYKDADTGSGRRFPKNLIVEFTTSDPSVRCLPAFGPHRFGLVNGSNGAELLTATQSRRWHGPQAIRTTA